MDACRYICYSFTLKGLKSRESERNLSQRKFIVCNNTQAKSYPRKTSGILVKDIFGIFGTVAMPERATITSTYLLVNIIT